ncbi:MAG: tetratricopeptide repeat protein, partial [Deltaproteobacteria bacterium]
SGPEARAIYTQALLAAGRAAEALDFARESAVAHPEAAELHIGLGLALLAAERPGDAVDAFSEALRIDPGRPEAHYDLAVAFALDGSVPAALGVVDAALAARPDDRRMAALREQLLAQLRGPA